MTLKCATAKVVAALFLISVHLVFANPHVIKVYPDCESTHEDSGNSTLTQALEIVASNDKDKGHDGWIISLETRGCYNVSEFHLIYNVRSSVSIVGTGSNSSHYLIHCADSVGMAFVQVSNLQISNVMIDGCGVSEKNVDTFTKRLNETVEMFHAVPRDIGYGIAIADCNNTVIDNVVIMNTHGIGLMLINVMGDSSINDLQLKYNRAPVCFYNNSNDFNSYKTIGGGMYVLYQDYKDLSNISGVSLSISNVYAYSNAYCQTLEGLNLVEEINPEKLRFSVGSAGSVGIALAQQTYGVHVTVASSEFRNNTGWISSGVTIVMFIGVKESQVLLDDCKFIRNGYINYQHRFFGLITAHSGLLVIKNVRFPVSKPYIPLSSSIKSLIQVTNSVFNGNTAKMCASVQLVLFRPVYENDTCQITFRNVVMTRNTGMVAPVLCASSQDGVADFSDFLVDLENVTVVDNRVDSLNDRSTQVNLWESSGQMLIKSINVIFKNTTITNNTGTGVIAVSSNIFISGNVLFHKNSANFGAGLQLLQHSHIIMEKNAHLEFSENNALFSGGAIFVANSHLYADLLNTDCFLYFGELDVICNFSSCTPVPDLNISMIFRDNNAVAFGGTVYGSTLNDCPWNYDYWPNSTADNVSALQMLVQVYPSYFNFIPPLTSGAEVGTDASRLHAVPIDNYNITINSTVYDVIYPGEEKFYNISAYDSFGYRTNALLLSSSEDPSRMNSSLSDALFWYVHSSQKNGTRTPLVVKGVTGSTGSVDIFSQTSPASMNIKIHLSDCGFGFDYEHTTEECICDRFTPEGVTCNIKNHTLTVFHTGHWYGPAEQLDNHSVFETCFFDHCTLGVVSYRPYQIDSQCSTGFKRKGLLCSQCEDNAGMVFGSNKCKVCDNKNLYILIPLFAAAGIFIIVLIAFLDITVAHGYVNGFIFYCNCLNFFLPYLSSTPNLGIDYIFVFVSWINLSLGIEACFYNGMSELAKIGLRLVFPAYLYILMFLIVILSRYSKTISKIPFSAGRTFATIFILTYFSIFGTCIHLLGFIRVTSLDKDIDTPAYYGWQGDVSLPYGHQGHIYLVILSAVLITCFIIPLPFLLMFPPLLYRFRYTHKLKPILDAFWNPYRPSQRFWLGARALFRFAAYFLALYVGFPTNVFTFGLIIIACWFVQERFSPYQGFLRNSLDSFFVMNLVMVLFLSIHFDEFDSYNNHYQALLYCTVSAAYMAFGVIIVIHVMIRFPNLKDKARKICIGNNSPFHYLTSINGDNDGGKDNSDDDDSEGDTPPHTNTAVTYTEFREPLLDGSINRNSYYSTK